MAPPFSAEEARQIVKESLDETYLNLRSDVFGFIGEAALRAETSVDCRTIPSQRKDAERVLAELIELRYTAKVFEENNWTVFQVSW